MLVGFKVELGGTNEGNVEFLSIACKARVVWQTSEGADAREDGVGLGQSAGLHGTLEQFSHLRSSISRQRLHGLVPKAWVGPRHGLLVMVRVGNGHCCQSSNGQLEQHFGDGNET